MTNMEKAVTAFIGLAVLLLMFSVGSYIYKVGSPKPANDFTVSATEFVFSSTQYDYFVKMESEGEIIAWVDSEGNVGGDWQGIMHDYYAHQRCKGKNILVMSAPCGGKGCGEIIKFYYSDYFQKVSHAQKKCKRCDNWLLADTSVVHQLHE